jgi:hypothetical protein
MSGRALASTAGGGALAAALATGWVGAVLLIALVLVPTLAVCWVIADPDRPHRLAVLLTAWRHEPSAMVGTGNRTATAPTAEPD